MWESPDTWRASLRCSCNVWLSFVRHGAQFLRACTLCMSAVTDAEARFADSSGFSAKVLPSNIDIISQTHLWPICKILHYSARLRARAVAAVLPKSQPCLWVAVEKSQK